MCHRVRWVPMHALARNIVCRVGKKKKPFKRKKLFFFFSFFDFFFFFSL
jgi:hypothetical protein